MPDITSVRVKNTGHGELEFATSNSSSSSNGTSSSSSTSSDTSSGAPITDLNGTNIGTGLGVFAGVSGSTDVTLEFKTIQAGDGISLSQDGQTITITATGNGTTSNGVAISNGFALALGNAATYGYSWTGPISLTDNTPVSAAMAQFNQLFSLLVPSAPPAFPNSNALTITNAAGNIPLLAFGVTDHANSGLSAGSAVTRVTGGSVSTNTFANMGPANTGQMQLLVNGGFAGTHTMTGSGDSGTYGGMVISNEQAYPPTQPGFYTSFNVGVTGATALQGVDSVQLKHTAAGSTNTVFFVADTLTSTPTVSGGSIAQSSAGTLAYSSSVPHYGTGASLLINASIANLAGQTYYGGSDPFIVSGTNSIISAQAYTYANLSITTPIAQNTFSAQPINPVLVNVNGTTFGQGYVQAVAKNVNGAAGATSLSNTVVLVFNGSPTGVVNELSVPVLNHGALPNNNNAIRVGGFSAGDTPTGTANAWVSSLGLQQTDAAVVAGVLSNNQTNYSMGYLPVGPNLSQNRNNAQYVTFMFNRSSVSTFTINVTGTYAGVWIKLPGVSDNNTISPNATNGWWNAGVPYSGAGVPGNASDATAGCAVGGAMLGASGSYSITFGPQTSTNATGNAILVRIRLNAGQSITSLSFS